MGNSPKTSNRTAGRRNIAIACENCRARKVRCDGCRPVCQACVRRNYDCEYTVSLAPWDRSRQRYVAELERRLGVRQDKSTPSRNPASASPPLNELTGFPPPMAQTPVGDHDFQGNACSETTSSRNGPSPLNGSVHVGQSSTGVFLRHLHHSVVPSSRQSPRAFTLSHLGSHTPICTATSTQYALPARKRADELLAHYWETHHPIYPAVCRTGFLQDLEVIYAGKASEAHRMSYCLANLMFALAERSMPPPDTLRRDGSHDYFETAKHLLHFDMFGNFSFALVQALVLSAQYLQSTEKPRQCWAIVGFGITAAQSLGLHLPEAIDNMSPESDGRLALSVWNCLVTLDRTLSMTLGRSPRVSLPVAKASTAANHRRSQHLDDSSMLFDQSCRLFDVLHEILNLLYNEGPEVAPVIDIIGHSSRLEKELDQWTQELPEQLRLDGTEKASSHAYFMRQRYLQVRIILMRPGLLHFIKASTASAWDLEQATTSYCANQSVEAAAEMAEISAAQTHPTTTPWWYRLQYCYNAGVTLMAARLSERLTEGSRIQKLDSGISNCALAIEACSLVSSTASRCLSMFESVARRLGREAPTRVDEDGQAAVDMQSTDPMNSMLSWDESWTSLWTDNAFYPMPDQPWEDLLSLI